MIRALTITDCFRSQFRIRTNAPKSPVQVVKFGLDHLQSLRMLHFQERDAKQRREAELSERRARHRDFLIGIATVVVSGAGIIAAILTK